MDIIINDCTYRQNYEEGIDMILEQEQRDKIRGIECGAQYPTGVGQIDRDDCPLYVYTPTGCMFCEYGHMLECHYPWDCETANCSYYLVDVLIKQYHRLD